MAKKGKAIVIEKRIECIIGILLLISPFINVYCYLLDYMSGAEWTDESHSSVLIFIGLIALAGAYLFKDGFRYFFQKDSNNSE